LERKETRWIFTLKATIVPTATTVSVWIPAASLVALADCRRTVVAIIQHVSLAASFKPYEATWIVETERIDTRTAIIAGAALIPAFIRAALFTFARAR
tara:strand:+ start:902 stop:1195 length:294 start_codon:yes stop_codon:yes gene_type:complete